MALFDFNSFSSALNDSSSNDGVTFAGLAKKWEKESDVDDLIKAMDECKNLTFLNIEGNTLGCEAAKRIGEALKKHPEFKRALWKDLFTGRMKTEIPIALTDLSQGMMFAKAQLTVLDLSDNALGPNGMKGLVDLIRSSTCYSLQELRLMNCGLGITGAKMLAESLNYCYEQSMKVGTPIELRVFAAGRNRLENDGAKALSAVFSKMQSLQEIVIPQNGIYHQGMSALSEALKQNVNLQIINFNDNTVTAKGAEYLAEAFYSIENLREINLGDCLLRNSGGQILSDVLSDCHPDLEYLNLSGNEIGPEVGLSIANSMGHKESLHQLILDSNCFGEEGIEAISQIMEDFGKLDLLSIEDDEGEADEDENEDDCDDEYQEEEDEHDEGNEETEEDEECIVTSFKAADQPKNDSFNFNSSLKTSDEDPVAAFYNHASPSLALFQEISGDRYETIKNALSACPQDEYLSHLVFIILKLAAISDQSPEAGALTSRLFEEAFEYGKNNDRIQSIRNFFLIQLGFLKSEDKKFKTKYSQESCRTALKNALSSKNLPEDEKNIFNAFLNPPQ